MDTHRACIDFGLDFSDLPNAWLMLADEDANPLSPERKYSTLEAAERDAVHIASILRIPAFQCDESGAFRAAYMPEEE